MKKNILTRENIRLGVSLNTKEEAIRYVGELLVANGYVDVSYIDKMLEREEITSTFMGNGVAIPHGTDDAKKSIHVTGIVVVTVPDGVAFGDNTVNVLIGIAGKGDEHLEVLSNIAIVCSEEENIKKIMDATSPDTVIDLFSEVN